MIQKIRCPTILFTLSVTDMQWPYFHKLMSGKILVDPGEAMKHRHQNLI